VALPVGTAADDEADGGGGAAFDEDAGADGGVVGVADTAADAEADVGSTTFGGAVVLACFAVDLQPVTNKTEHNPMLRTAVCRRIFVPSLVA
jgi:hypothetical protein